MLRILVVGLLALVAVMFMARRPQSAKELANPVPLPDFELVDQNRHAFSKSSLEGHFTLLFFGYTRCPAVCPRTLRALAAARAALEKRPGKQAPAIVFVGVDTKRDSPDSIRDYLRSFDPQFLGVTAHDSGALEPLTHALGVPVQTQTIDGEHYRVVRDGTVYVIDRNAGMIALLKSTDARRMLFDYLRIRAQHSRSVPPRDPKSRIAAL